MAFCIYVFLQVTYVCGTSGTMIISIIFVYLTTNNGTLNTSLIPVIVNINLILASTNVFSGLMVIEGLIMKERKTYSETERKEEDTIEKVRVGYE